MIIRAFSDYELKKMSEEGNKPTGWHTYKDSPYKEHKKLMEELGYEGSKAGDNKTDLGDAKRG